MTPSPLVVEQLGGGIGPPRQQAAATTPATTARPCRPCGGRGAAATGATPSVSPSGAACCCPPGVAGRQTDRSPGGERRCRRVLRARARLDAARLHRIRSFGRFTPRSVGVGGRPAPQHFDHPGDRQCPAPAMVTGRPWQRQRRPVGRGDEAQRRRRPSSFPPRPRGRDVRCRAPPRPRRPGAWPARASPPSPPHHRARRAGGPGGRARSWSDRPARCAPGRGGADRDDEDCYLTSSERARILPMSFMRPQRS